MINYVLGTFVIGAMVFAAYKTIKKHKDGTGCCGCGCAGCHGGSCSACTTEKTPAHPS